jgi:hypothetical protein
MHAILQPAAAVLRAVSMARVCCLVIQLGMPVDECSATVALKSVVPVVCVACSYGIVPHDQWASGHDAL